MIDPRLITQLHALIEAEIGTQRTLLTIAEARGREIIAGNIPAFTALETREQQPQADAARLRQARERLLRAIAAAGNLKPEELCVSRIANHAPADRREPLIARAAELRKILERLQQVHERNALLMRHSLGLVREILHEIAGPTSPAAHPYDHRGGIGATTVTRGGLLNLRG